jgi:hypothetical protein
MKRFLLLGMLGMIRIATQTADAGNAEAKSGFLWKESTPPEDCPFEPSQDFKGLEPYFQPRTHLPKLKNGYYD